MVREKIRGNLIVISGPSGCGKGTVCSELLNRNPKLFLSISMTTRDPRKGEVDGVDYYFVTKDDFELRIKSKSSIVAGFIINDSKTELTLSPSIRLL